MTFSASALGSSMFGFIQRLYAKNFGEGQVPAALAYLVSDLVNGSIETLCNKAVTISTPAKERCIKEAEGRHIRSTDREGTEDSVEVWANVSSSDMYAPAMDLWRKTDVAVTLQTQYKVPMVSASELMHAMRLSGSAAYSGSPPGLSPPISFEMSRISSQKTRRKKQVSAAT